MLVKDAMTPDPVTCSVDDTVSSIGGVMRTKHIGGIPVMDGTRLAGMVTETDLLKLLMTKGPSDDLWLPSPLEVIELPIREFINWERTKEALTDIGSKKVGTIMSSPIITITSEEDIEAAADLMLKKKIDRLAVVSGEILKGIITREDIVWAISGGKGTDAHE
ncbi:MAG TPA: CBS domain-containing protein [Methanospirillum sp.]|uniref:CBS domain-containing protein n=1 Tax=Methanospirillum sp. TaxID=45200 RepID=UPI002CA64F94|nr:CBS domain-containing protein [Methanospirillum sp.]HWQ64441.1 CBS domain-containing protein [Methanospirillum sp.]